MRGINHHEDFSWSNVLRKGSSGGTSTTIQNNGPPPDVLATYKAVTQQAQNVANQPYPVYNGQLIAGFNPQQQTAFQNINTASTAAQPFIDAASGLATNATTLLSPQNFGGTIAAYQDPYTKQVVDATQAEFNNQNAIKNQSLIGNAISSGAWGGDRAGVAQGIAAGQEALAQAPVIAGLNDKGFSTALGAAQGNAWLNSQGAFSMGQLGQEAQNTGLSGAGAQLQAGTLQQQLQQQQLNLPYEAFLAAQGFPYQATGWLSNIDLGLGSASGGTGSTTVPGPSALSQAAGVGTALAGLAGAANNAGWFGNNYGPSASQMAQIQSDASAFAGGNFVPAVAGTDLPPIYRRGGAVGGFADGGVPNLDVSFIPSGPSPFSGGHSMLQPSGSTSSTSGGGPSDMQQAQSAISTIGSIVGIVSALDRGGRTPEKDARNNQHAGFSGDYFGRDVGGSIGFGGAEVPTPRAPHPHPAALTVARDVLESLGGLGSLATAARTAREPDSEGGRVTGLDPMAGIEGYDIGGTVPSAPRRSLSEFETPTNSAQRQIATHFASNYDIGGTVPSAPAQAMFSGDPILTQNFSQYTGLPTEKLQELSVRLPPTTPQGAMIARALRQRRMAPQADPAQAPSQPAQGFAGGGLATSLPTGSWQDDAPELGGDAGALPDFADYVPVAAERGPVIPQNAFLPAHGTSGPPAPPPASNGGLGAGARDTGEPIDGQGTFGGAPVGRGKSILSDPDTLIAMGLGMLGGRSPFPGVNIGAGGLEGLKFGEQKQLREEQAALRALQQQQLGDYRRALLPIRQQTADATTTRATTGVVRLQNQQDIANRALQLRAADLDETRANHQAMQEYRQQQGELVLGKAFDNTQYRQARLNQIDQTIDLRKQAMQFAYSEAAKKFAQTAEAGDLQRAVSILNSSRDPFTKVPKITLDEAMTQVQAQHAKAASSGGAGPLPMPRSAAEAVPGSIYNTGRGPARWDGSQFIPVSP